MVVPTSLARKIDEWRRQEADLPNFSEAFRRLAELGLEVAKERRLK